MPLTLMKGNTMPEQTKTTEEEVQIETDDDLDEKLIESVQAKLDIINGDVEDTKTAEEETNQQTEETEEVAESTPEKKADESTTEEESTSGDKTEDTDATKGEDGDKTTKEVLLPDAYYRAAVHQGWKPDEIKEFFEADPEMAMKTLAKIHESTNKLSSEFARLGRISLKPADKAADSQTATEVDTAKSVDIAAIKEQYGDDSAVVKAFEVMQSKLDAVATSHTEPNPVSGREDWSHGNRQEFDFDPAAKTMVDKFFIDPALKLYEDFYGAGKNAEKLTQEQNGHRFSMLEMADNIILGSQAQGRPITAEEAMEAAHLLVSEPVREKALRTELSTRVKRRAKGVTLKPTKTKAAKTVTDGKVTEEQLEERVREKLQNVFR